MTIIFKFFTYETNKQTNKQTNKLASLFIALLIIAGTSYSCKKESPSIELETDKVTNNTQSQSNTKVSLISICCDIARQSKECKTGGGICNCYVTIGKCNGGARSRALDVKLVGNNLFIESAETFPDDAGLFVFTEPTVMEADVAKSLGFNEVTVLPGTYTVHQSNNKQKVKLDVITN